MSGSEVSSCREWEQDPAARQLRQDLRCGGVAHAYLLAGRAPEKKKGIVPAFVQALLCTDPGGGMPCGACTSCRAWEHRAHPDYHYLVPEGGSLKTDQIRLWRPFFQYRPQLGRRHVFLMDRPELLTPPAANSLLKILEEPLGGTVFLLVTEDERGVLPTIVSRCRVVIFRPEAPGDGGEPPDDNLDIRKAGEIAGIVRKGTPAELLREIRLAGMDRSGARALLTYLLAEFEQEYRRLRPGLQGGCEEMEKARGAAECLKLLLEGLKLLDENVSVPLLLSLILYKIQKRMRGAE